ncbi:MAG: SRPBCC family protein [Acidimicrobiales bacterium]
MIVAGAGCAVIERSAQDVLEFALDLDRCRRVDPKFRRVRRHHMRGDEGEVRYSGTLRGIPTPADTQSIRLTRWTRLDSESIPSPLNRLARFHGWFECEERGDGPLVRHREQFDFSPAIAWLAAPILKRCLQDQVQQEVQELKRQLEASRG